MTQVQEAADIMYYIITIGIHTKDIEAQ